MGAGSVTTGGAETSWKLLSPHDKETQGIVVSGFADLRFTKALFLRAGGRGAGWVKALRDIEPITDATRKEEQSRVATLAFTAVGLQELGLHKDVLKTFATPFTEGMYQEDRLRRLGDKIDGEWLGTVAGDGPAWGGSANVRDQVKTETVHALLLLYGATFEDVRSRAEAVERALASYGVAIVHRLCLDLEFDETKRIAREHFGFADGLSQPVPTGAGVAPSNDPGQRETLRWHGVPLGEVLLGHPNAHNENSLGPFIAEEKIEKGKLHPEGAPEGFLNLGLNGSYMVVRELRQDVAAFWSSLENTAREIRTAEPTAKDVSAEWLAQRIVGRTLDGDLLRPEGTTLGPNTQGHVQNDFGFLEDPHGYGCPLGSHVRRSNPRDGLAAKPDWAQTLLDAANAHRILRRGRRFGPPIKKRDEDDGQKRGLLFICLNADISRQFEFIQQTWVLNQNFETLFNETDPLVGPKGPFSIQAEPLRRVIEVKTFVQMVGGEYFFLPSIPALDYLAELKG